MKSTSSDHEPYFCSEPWTGIVDISVAGDVIFCPCYLNLRIGNVHRSELPEIWNGPVLLEMREQFTAGELPALQRSAVSCRAPGDPGALTTSPPRLFLLGGAAFSGKTLLAFLLNQGNLVCLDEPDFHDARQHHRGVPVLRQLFPDAAIPDLPAPALTHDGALDFLEACATALHPRVLGMKTAGYTSLEYAKAFRARGYPTIAVYRDLRDALAEAPLPPWLSSEQELAASYRAVHDNRSLFDLVVRYEDLVTSPGLTLGAISRLVGEPLELPSTWSPEAVPPWLIKLDRHEMLRAGRICTTQVGLWRSAPRRYPDDIHAVAQDMGYDGPGDYRTSHLSPDCADRFDSHYVYGRGHLNWAHFEQPYLDALFEQAARDHPGRYLDFACGTGRILQVAAPHFTESVGIDVSRAMLDGARPKAPSAELICADVMVDPPDVGPFSVISLFRFLLNAQQPLRDGVLRWLRQVIEPTGILVADNHLNGRSLEGLRHRVAEGGRRPTDRDVREWLRRGGFEVVETYGFGVIPPWRPNGRVPSRALLRIERSLQSATPLQRLAKNRIFLCRPRR